MNPRLAFLGFLLLLPVAVAVLPQAGSHLIYDRAAILSGEAWRLFTGHWVHFSTSHLLGDALALVAGVLLLPADRLKTGLTAALTASMVIPLGLWWLQPALDRYAGMSGIALALLGCSAAMMLFQNLRPRFWGGILMTGMLAKLIHEAATGHLAFVSASPDVVPATLAHALGMLTGAVVGLISQRKDQAPAGSPAPAVPSATAVRATS